MSEPRKHGAPGVWAAAILVGLFAIPFVYLLLLGPLQYLTAYDFLSGGVWEVLAMPLAVSLEHSGGEPSWFWDAYESYLLWWVNLV